MVPSIFVSMIAVPVYVRTVVSVRIRFVFTPTPEAKTGLGAAMLVGVTTGAAAVLALIAGLTVFLVRNSREVPDDGPTTGKANARSVAGTKLALITNEGVPEGRRATIVTDQLNDSTALSTCEFDDSEDSGVFL
jgi:hypothetical protein